MLSTLVEGRRQHLAGQGTTPRGDLFEIYTSEENGTWTLIVTRPGLGVSCVAAAGREAWESMKGSQP